MAELVADGHLEINSPETTAALLSGAMNEAVLRIAAAPDRDAALADTWPDLLRLLRGLRGIYTDKQNGDHQTQEHPCAIKKVPDREVSLEY
jgi:hypothetical protein